MVGKLNYKLNSEIVINISVLDCACCLPNICATEFGYLQKFYDVPKGPYSFMSVNRRYIAEIFPIRRKSLSNHSIYHV